MKPYTRSIIELFDGKRRYLIPLYQRQYAWQVTPQLEFLWDDIVNAVERLKSDRSALTPHFMGAIVISQIKTFGKAVQSFEVIDGQQRLTTFQILLAALRDVALRYNSNYGNEMQSYLLNDGVMERPVIERYKLWPSLTDRQAFVAMIDPEADLSEIADISDESIDVGKRSSEAYSYFHKQIDQHVKSDDINDTKFNIEILFEALKDGLAVVSIELESGDDPQTIFETLNSRGLDLTAGDLMRNFIFQRAMGLGQSSGSLKIDKLYKDHWLPLDKGFWQQKASRGRQSKLRLDWMLTDHLSMHLGRIVSVNALFDSYRKWIKTQNPMPTSEVELAMISETAEVEHRLFEQSNDDPLGTFGRFADAFDVSTAMPLVIYLSITLPPSDLIEALDILESYILRRDICGLTTKNYNKGFVGIIDRLRESEDDILTALMIHLSSRQSDIDRWPNDDEFQQQWLDRDQYKPARQPRLRHILEAIERQKRSNLNEDIEIKSTLTIEHIMPQKWQENWPVEAEQSQRDEDTHMGLSPKETLRSSSINKMGNLTLLTHGLNASVSNGPFEIKMPAVRANSTLSLNRDLSKFVTWDEETILQRGGELFDLAKEIWSPPLKQQQTAEHYNNTDAETFSEISEMPPNGTVCFFIYFGKTFDGRISDDCIEIHGIDGRYKSFSSASKAVTNTSRNGWYDWVLKLPGTSLEILADQWRKGN